jgi:copper chaperone CopZ
MTKHYQIIGMHCEACVAKITEALASVVDHVSVSLNPPRATVQGGQADNLDQLNRLVAAKGSYTLMPVESADSAVIAPAPVETQNWIKTYYPLLLIVGLISVVSLKGSPDFSHWMMHFMAGFFIVFGFFKLLDIRGFRDAYAGYDLLAKKWYGYGFIYPFLELGLGFAFLFHFQIKAALWFSILLMGFGSIGVIQAVRRKQTIRCACLGTVLNLPMSTITIIENMGMVAMSAAMLWMM